MIILVGGFKGGSGKSTLAANLAQLRAAAGIDVLLVDADNQRSTALWSDIRREENISPAIPHVELTGKTIHVNLRDLAERYIDIIVDAGGRDSVEQRAAMTVADVMLIPNQPSQYDLWPLEALEELLGHVLPLNPELKPLVVLNRVNPNPRIREAEEAKGYMADYEVLGVADTVIHDRIIFRRSVREGRGVSEVRPPDPKASAEILALYGEVFNNG